ncbi:MBL fold metallo-hydrolase, partial [Streptomyces parvulus]
WTKDAAEEVGQAVAFPRPGEPFEPAGELPVEEWWRAVSGLIAHPWRRPRIAEDVAGTGRGGLDLAGER